MTKTAWFSFVFFFGLAAAARAQEGKVSCAKAMLSATGLACSDLAIKFDLSACPHAADASAVTIRCNGEHATALVQTSTMTYSVSAILWPGASGTQVWTLARDPSETALAAHEEHKEKKKKNKHKKKLLHTDSKDPTHTGEDPNHATAPMPAPAAAPTNTWQNTFTLSGLSDFYYSWNFNNPPQNHTPPPATAETSYDGLATGQTQYRNYDIRSNQFVVNLVELSIKKTTDETAMRLDLDFGDETDIDHRDSSNRVDEVSKHIGQAILSYNPAKMRGLTFNIGKMLTHLGWEKTKAKANWQYSRSLLYVLALPHWHVGINAGYTPNDKIAFNLYVYNSANNMVGNNAGKSIGAEIVVMPNHNSSLLYNNLIGPEQPNDNKDLTSLHELIFTWSCNTKVELALDAVIGLAQNESLPSGRKGTGRWSAVEAALKFSPTAAYYLSPRIETFMDTDGLTTGVVQMLKSATLTNSLTLSNLLEGRFELRINESNKDVFIKEHTVSKMQPTMTFAMLSAF